MAIVNCQIEIPDLKGLEKNDLTVGRDFFLICKGDWPKFAQVENLKINLPEQQKYTLQMRGFEMRDAQTAAIKVTSYVAGPMKYEKLSIGDGAQSVELSTFDFTVRSVIEQKPDEKVEPYGAIGPIQISIPILYWFLLFAVIASIGSYIFVRIRRRIQRQALLDKMHEHDVALSPLHDFHHKLRRLQRDNEFYHGKAADAFVLQKALDQINQLLRVYLIRRFRVPALDWSDSLILKDLKRYHLPVFAEHHVEIRKLFKEIAQAQKAKNLDAQDIIQLTEHTRKAVEKLDRAQTQRESTGSAKI